MAIREGSVTVLAEPHAQVPAVAAATVFGVEAVFPLVADRYIHTPPVSWTERLPVSVVAVWLAVGGVIVVLGSFRALVMGVRISHAGVVVRNYFRTYKLSWPEVARFADGSTPGGLWALNVVTRSGLAVTASGTATSREVLGDVVTAIVRVAGRYGIAADVRGRPAKWEGPQSRLARGVIVSLVIMGLLFVVVAFWPGFYHCPSGQVCGA